MSQLTATLEPHLRAACEQMAKTAREQAQVLTDAHRACHRVALKAHAAAFERRREQLRRASTMSVDNAVAANEAR